MFFDGSGLFTVSFDKTSSEVINNFDPLVRSLYSDIDLTAQNNTFDVSDDCKAFRINNFIFHKNSDNSYNLDDLPSGATPLINPVLIADASLLITDSGIYSYTSKSAST